MKRRVIATALSIAGSALLAVAALGQWTPLGDYASAPPRPWEAFDAELAGRTASAGDLLDEARARSGDWEALAAEGRMEILYGVVAERFTHGEARHSFFGNWLLWLAGKAHPALGHVWGVRPMIARGHSLMCDQVSYILLDLARASGVTARHVGLNGHVVMEAWHGGEWRAYDPDLEVVARDGEGRVMSVDALARDAALVERYYGERGAAAIVASREDNSAVSYPPGARFEWKSQALATLEPVMQGLKFVLPLAMIAAGWGMRRRRVA